MPFITLIVSFFTNFLANIKTYAIIIGVVLLLALVGYVWYKLSSDENTIATLTANNKTLTTAVATIQTTENQLQTDIHNVQAATAQTNAELSTIQVNAAKKAQTIQSTNYDSEAAQDSTNLTNSVNTDIANEFNQIQSSGTIGTSK